MARWSFCTEDSRHDDHHHHHHHHNHTDDEGVIAVATLPCRRGGARSAVPRPRFPRGAPPEVGAQESAGEHRLSTLVRTHTPAW